jgi:SNF2 family DNA or RNA helicase
MTGADSIVRGDIFRSATTSRITAQATQGTDSSLRAPDDAVTEPSFINPERADALTRLIIGGQEQAPAIKRKRQTPDEIKIKRSSVNFHAKNKPKRTVDGLWKLPRMKSTLEPYQLLGASWLRWRELATKEPFGGILADQMGLGKTVEMLAAITDGLPDKVAKKKGFGTTLIVVPLSILNQWRDEIHRHCEQPWIGTILVYRGNEILKYTSDPVEFMQSHDIM